MAPREEIAPTFSRERNGGPGGKEVLAIEAENREGIQGTWSKEFPVKGGARHHFRALAQWENIASPRRSVHIRITWLDAEGERTPHDAEDHDVFTLAPGSRPRSWREYPAFDTRFGTVGMMICWDVHFPEVARRISNNGAEIIAMPIAGGNPELAKARAIENQVYLLTSTLTPLSRPDWMRSGVFGPSGDLLAAAEEWGTVVVKEVDPAKTVRWDNLGDFRARIHRERP